MLFSSLTFIFLFLPIVIGLYMLLPNRTLKNVFLFIVSLLFYAWGEPIYVFLMLFSTFNDYILAQFIQKEKDCGNLGKAKAFLALSIIVNLSILVFFKYLGFVVDNMNSLFSMHLSVAALPLPIGISFYTFQTMSYSIDVYRGNVRAQKKFLVMATYVTLFPQLIAGPIVRYITVEDELENRVESLEGVVLGLKRFIIGLSKKVIIANQMGFIADTIYSNSNGEAGTLLLWLGAVAYTFQIYYDFSGYSDMAIGLGRVFGFHYLENFNYPYIAKNITDFWRRWHISLSSWFRDYLYIPLGGNRRWAIRNLFIVWFLTGLWHGASWNYIFWGLYYGILIFIEKYILKNILNKVPRILQHFYAMFFVIIGWVFFRIENFEQLVSTLKNMFSYREVTLKTILFDYQDMLYAVPFIIFAVIGAVPIMKNIFELIENRKSNVLKYLKDIYIIGCLVLSIIFLLGEKFNPFIYFRF